MRSSDIFFVSVVTRTRSPATTRSLIMAIRSSIWPLVGLMTTSGSIRPVGRMICSTTWVEWSISHAPGVADRKIVWPTRSTHSSKRSGRLSAADGNRNPCSISVAFRDRSPSYWPWSWGIVTCDSSMMVR